MQANIKLLLIGVISAIFGKSVYSEKVEKWCYLKAKEVHKEKAKKTGASWLVVIWNWQERKYHFIGQRSELDMKLCIWEYSRRKDHWFLETIEL